MDNIGTLQTLNTANNAGVLILPLLTKQKKAERNVQYYFGKVSSLEGFASKV